MLGNKHKPATRGNLKVGVLAVMELKQVLKIVEELADYIALGVTGEIAKRQWSGY
jgi:hypothetical protein